jgi:hypothetical protein
MAAAIFSSIMRFQCLDHPPYSPDLAPSDCQLFPGLIKHLVAIFHLSPRSLLPRRRGWTDNLLNFFFFEWLAKVKATG